MNDQSLTFFISKNEYIEISWSYFISVGRPFDNGLAYYHNFDQKILLDNFIDSVFFTKNFTQMMQLAITKKLIIHSSITHDIGYDYNYYARIEYKPLHSNRKKYVYTDADNEYWVGSEYSLFRTQDVSTWLYNDVQGNIILAITPNYPWTKAAYSKKSKVPYVTFHKFMKDYKPLVKIILPDELIKKWIIHTKKEQKRIVNLARQYGIFEPYFREKLTNKHKHLHIEKPFDTAIAVPKETGVYIGIENHRIYKFVKQSIDENHNEQFHKYVEPDYNALSEREKKALFDAKLIKNIQTGKQ